MSTKSLHIFFILIIFFFTLTTITSATTPSTPSIKTQSPSNQHLQNIIQTLMNSEGGFSNWAVALSATNPSNFPITATLFIPSDKSLSNITSSQFLQFDPLTLAYHIVPQELPFSLLLNLKIGSRIPTLLPNKTILVTNNTESNYRIDSCQITHPNLYTNGGSIAVHGIGSLLNYSVFGNGGGDYFLEDDQISNPFLTDQSPEFPGSFDEQDRPMGLVKSEGWCLNLTAKNQALGFLYVVLFVLGWLLESRELHIGLIVILRFVQVYLTVIFAGILLS